jgi:hypothetical protein
MRRFQFSLRALMVAMLAVACFFGGIRFERERRRRADEAAMPAQFGFTYSHDLRVLFPQTTGTPTSRAVGEE